MFLVIIISIYKQKSISSPKERKKTITQSYYIWCVHMCGYIVMLFSFQKSVNLIWMCSTNGHNSIEIISQIDLRSFDNRQVPMDNNNIKHSMTTSNNKKTTQFIHRTGSECVCVCYDHPPLINRRLSLIRREKTYGDFRKACDRSYLDGETVICLHSLESFLRSSSSTHSFTLLAWAVYFTLAGSEQVIFVLIRSIAADRLQFKGISNSK